MNSSTDTNYYKFLLDLSLAINRHRHLPLQSVLSKLIQKYNRNSFANQHYCNILKCKSFYVLDKYVKSRKLQRKSMSKNNSMLRHDVRKHLEFSENELRKTLNLLDSKPLPIDRKSARSSVRMSIRRDSNDKENSNTYNHKPLGTLRSGETSINIKSNVLDDAQYLETRVSLRSKASTQNLPVADSRILSNTTRSKY